MGDGNLSQEEIDALLSMGDEGGSDESGMDLDALLGDDDSSTGASLDQASLDALTGGSLSMGGGGSGGSVSSSRTKSGASKDNVNLLMDVILNFTVELGRTHMLIRDVLHLEEGSVVELEKNAGDDVDVLINDRLFGRGRLIVVDEYFAVQITHVLDPLDRYRVS